MHLGAAVFGMGAAVALGAGGSAAAQANDRLDVVVVTATRQSQSARELPQSVAVVSGEALRSAEGGARATLGLMLGLGYFMLQRMVESGMLAFGLDPLLLAWLPFMLLAAVLTLLLLRLRGRV